MIRHRQFPRRGRRGRPEIGDEIRDRGIDLVADRTDDRHPGGGNGARHLLWDTGRGFEKAQANLSSWLVLISTVALTAVFWWLAS